MKIALLALVVASFCTASVLALRSGPTPTTEEIVARSPWIFAGRVLRYEASASDLIGATDVKVAVLAGLPLRGSPPMRVVLSGIRGRPFEIPIHAEKVLIFFGGPFPTPHPGIDGVLYEVRPFSELKSIRGLINQAQTPK